MFIFFIQKTTQESSHLKLMREFLYNIIHLVQFIEYINKTLGIEETPNEVFDENNDDLLSINENIKKKQMNKI